MKILLTIVFFLGLIPLCNAQTEKNEESAEIINLLKQSNAAKGHEGDNVLLARPGYSIVAKVKKGSVSEIIARDNDGKEYQPQSITKVPSQNSIARGKVKVMKTIYIYCFYIPGWGWRCAEI